MPNPNLKVIILAGYHKEMTTFLNTNPGLPSRFPNTFNFADYTSDEMAQILKHVVISKGFELPEELAHDALVALVRQCIKPGEVSQGPNPNPNPNPSPGPNPNPNPNPYPYPYP